MFLTFAFMEPVYYIPLFTCTVSIIFSIQLYRHWKTKKQSLYLFWWMLGVLTFGAGTFTESFNTLMGWHEWNFKAWYITGALLGGAPLAQGTVYLLLKRRTANILTSIFLLSIALRWNHCVCQEACLSGNGCDTFLLSSICMH